MKLVGKKLYRVAPLKCFKGGGGAGAGGGALQDHPMAKLFAKKKTEPTPEELRMQEWEKEAKKDLFDPEQKALYERRKQLAEDVGSGAAARRGAEAGLKAQMAAAGAGRGSAAQRMRGLARAGEAGVKAAGAQGAASAGQQFGMLGQAGQGRFGMQKSDKAGRLGYYQKRRGLEVAEKAAKEQAAAARSANSGGKASGGEIFKKYRNGGEFPRKNGKIEGPGTETSDDIKAKLSDGEFVVNAKTVRGIGESMGAKGKEQSRAAGSGFLYDLQKKYGDKKPVEKFLGGMQIAELGAHAAKKGLLGKKLKGVGSIASGALDVKKGIDKKEADRVEKETSGFGKQIKNVDFAKGGDVKLGKGIKAKRKFREAIGWEADKVFDKKAEKDYKEGHTGYKNYKGEKSVTPIEMGLGGFLGKIGKVALGAGKGFLMSGGNPAGAVMGGAKGAMDVASEDKQKSQAKKQAVAEATIAGAEKKKEAAQGLQEDIQLKKGGDVKKDHPHKKYLDDLDKFMAHHFPKGKKVDLDPGRKADKGMKAKKGSIEPVELRRGKFIDMSGDKPHQKGIEEGKKKYLEDLKKSKLRAEARRVGMRKLHQADKLGRKKAEDETAEARRIGTKKIHEAGKKALDLKRRRESIKASDRGLIKKAKMQKEAFDEEDKAEARRKGMMKLHQADKKAKTAPEVSGWGKQLKGVDTSKLSKGLKDKEEKSWWGKMPDKDKAGIIMGAGKGLISARQEYLKDKQKRREALAKGLSTAAGTRALAGRQLIAAPVSLRKGGRVSFKDVLKAKKKMGY